MELNKPVISQLKRIYGIKKNEIISRLKEFKKLWSDGNDEEIFTELAFCILTPQSKAKSCWDAIAKLEKQDLLSKGTIKQIKQGLNCVRFKNKKGIGYKEASHFLRNIGFGEKIAILDRHILRNLNQLGIIEEIPKSISQAKYMQIEKNMMEFAKQINIPLSDLDLLFWY